MRARRPIVVEVVTIESPAMFAALALGLLIGLNTPLSISKTALTPLALMIFAQVIAEEIFFRGYIGRLLIRGMIGSVTPAVLSATIYALYQLTYFAVWHGGAGGVSTSYRVVVAAISGAIYALLHEKSESMSAPLVAHFTAAGAMVVGSMY